MPNVSTVLPPRLESAVIGKATPQQQCPASAVLNSPLSRAFLENPRANAIQKIGFSQKTGSAVLRASNALVVNFANSDLVALVRGMETVLPELHGIGLTACQIGVGVALFLVDLGGCLQYGSCTLLTLDGHDLLSGPAPGVMVFINPVITQKSGNEGVAVEGCLSVPDLGSSNRCLKVKVVRPSHVTVVYHDLTGKTHTLQANGWPARCIQHEYDHILGVLITDYDPHWREKVYPLPRQKEEKEMAKVPAE